jgi:uncharacterized protein YukE
MTMAGEGMFRVDLEALTCSVAQVFEQGQDLAGAHLSSDNRIAAAESGWVGASAAALHDRMAKWLETSRTLLSRVGGHASELNGDGIDFAATERDSVEQLRAVGESSHRQS